VEDRIRYLGDLLKNARIAATSGGDAVTVGSTVRLEQENVGEKKSLLFTIVGSEEADMSQGKISNLSPIGSALIGHKKGDVIKVQTPKGPASYLIAAIK
jgi:transcription elongation factor GreA